MINLTQAQLAEPMLDEDYQFVSDRHKNLFGCRPGAVQMSRLKTVRDYMAIMDKMELLEDDQLNGKDK